MELSRMEGLSNELTILVISELYELCEANAYLLDLRTVNKQFNEAILHVVFIASESKNIARYKVHDCRRRDDQCFTTKCAHASRYGSYTSLYARSFLQGRLASPKRVDPDLHGIFWNLNVAVSMIQGILAQENLDTTPLSDKLQQLQPLTTTNPQLLDRVQMAVCQAALHYVGSTLIFQNLKHFQTTSVERQSPQFWVLNTACYLGSTWLIEYTYGSTGGVELDVSPKQVDALLAQCLHIARERCPLKLVEDIMIRIDTFEPCGVFACPLFRAFEAGDVKLTAHVVRTHEQDTLSYCCCRTLSHATWHPARTKEQVQIFKALWPKTRTLHRRIRSTIVPNIARYGVIEALEYIHKHGKLDIGVRHDQVYSSAVFQSAIGGSLTCLQFLLDKGYLGPPEAASGTIRVASNAALRVNQLQTYLEFERRYPDMLLASNIVDIAGAEGTISLMQDCIRYEPEILTRNTWTGAELNIGQTALIKAMANLRVQNIEFLLGQGVRLEDHPVSIDWSYWSTHKEEFNKTQDILRASGIPLLEVEV